MSSTGALQGPPASRKELRWITSGSTRRSIAARRSSARSRSVPSGSSHSSARSVISTSMRRPSLATCRHPRVGPENSGATATSSSNATRSSAGLMSMIVIARNSSWE